MEFIDVNELLNWIYELEKKYRQEYNSVKREKDLILQKYILANELSFLEKIKLHIIEDSTEAPGMWVSIQKEPFINEKIIIWNGYEWNEGVYLKKEYPFNNLYYETGFYIYVPGIGYIQEEDVEKWMRIIEPK